MSGSAAAGGRAADGVGVRVTCDGPVASIWLDRPVKRNAMSYAMWIALAEACAEVDADPVVRVVVLRSSGPHFCAGADITELTVARPAGQPSFNEVNVAAEQALAAIAKPTVAYVEGDCIGGGCALAIDCDLRVAVSGARFGITPAKLGVVYPPASLERAARLLGAAGAKYLMFTGRLIDSAHALRIGLVDEVHEPAQGPAALDALCVELASRSLLTQAATKAMVGAVVEHGVVPAAMRSEWEREAALAGELDEGVAAFVGRRSPQFTWNPSLRT